MAVSPAVATFLALRDHVDRRRQAGQGVATDGHGLIALIQARKAGTGPGAVDLAIEAFLDGATRARHRLDGSALDHLNQSTGIVDDLQRLLLIEAVVQKVNPDGARLTAMNQAIEERLGELASALDGLESRRPNSDAGGVDIGTCARPCWRACSVAVLVQVAGPTEAQEGVEVLDSMMKRPAGVTIMAVLSLAAGIIYLLQGLRILGYVVFGPAQAFSNVSLTGWWTLIMGLIWLSVGGALLSLRPWAWMFAVIIVGLSLIEAFFGNLNGWQFGDLFVAMIVPLVILFYLNSEKVKASFGMEG